MNRITLADNSGRWFDIDAARRFDEKGMLAEDGTFVSLASGNSWEHETLYLTTNGTYIMHFFNDHNPSLSQFQLYDEEKGVQWLLRNGYADDVKKHDFPKAVDEKEC
jgi:hypothetical protein